MSRLLQRLANEMRPAMTYGELIVQYATILHEEDKAYHFDDDPSDIPCFTPEEALVVKLWTKRLHCEKLFSVSLKLHDPDYEE